MTIYANHPRGRARLGVAQPRPAHDADKPWPASAAVKAGRSLGVERSGQASGAAVGALGGGCAGHAAAAARQTPPSQYAAPGRGPGPQPGNGVADPQAFGAGLMTLRVFIDSASGAPHNGELSRSSGFAGLDAAARATVQGARLKPCRYNGQPLQGGALIPICFELESPHDRP